MGKHGYSTLRIPPEGRVGPEKEVSGLRDCIASFTARFLTFCENSLPLREFLFIQLLVNTFYDAIEEHPFL